MMIKPPTNAFRGPRPHKLLRWLAVPAGLRVLLLGLLLACAPNILAQTTATADDYPKKMHFRNIMQNQDIALGEVEAIVQDYQGFIWLGGRNALLRYDGYEFLPIAAAIDPTDLTKTEAVNQVVELLEDRQHTLWAGTRAGLYRYDRDHELLIPVPLDNRQNQGRATASALAEHSSGKILIGTTSGFGIFDPSNNSFRSFVGTNGGLLSGQIHDLYITPDDILWLGLDFGLARLNLATEQLELFIPAPENPTSTNENAVKTIALDHNNRIWAGTDNGVYRFDVPSQTFTTYRHDKNDPHSIGDNFIRQVYVDHNGWVWVGSDAGGLNLYNEKNNRWMQFERGEGGTGRLLNNNVRRIYEDHLGDMWIGTYPFGVNFYDKSSTAIRIYQKSTAPEKGPMDNNVEALLEDSSGNIWVGAQGISRFNPSTDEFTHYKHTQGPDSRVGSPAILNGLLTSTGDILFGTWGAAAQKYNPQTDRFDSLPANPNQSAKGEKSGDKLNDLMIWNIFEDKQKNLWFSTHYNGLTKYDPKTNTYYYYSHRDNEPDSLSTKVTWVSYEDSQGRLWAGTAYGLNLMDREKGTFKNYLPDSTKARSLANGSVLSIHEDTKGRLWFGTDMGLHLYSEDTDDFTVYDLKNGFIDQGIRAIVEDQTGNLWLGTNNGIVRFNPDTLAVKNYTRVNGELIGGIATGAALVLSDHTLAFGTRNGLYIFDPAKLDSYQNMAAPSIALTDFRLFTEKIKIGGADKLLSKAITQTESITLDYNQSMVSFSFAALNYRDPEKNLYAYMLEGFDNQWREVGNQRSALYTNLPAGTYQFSVKASNNDGLWNDQAHSIQLVVLPPPWKTWWAYSIYAATLLALILLFVRSQHQQVLVARAVSRELETKVKARTAELQNKNQELEYAYAQLEDISLSDPLTGLSNRRYLQKLMPMDIAKVQREYNNKKNNYTEQKSSQDLVFSLLDVDHFKQVNDVFGHNAGDQLLIQLSNLLSKAGRESDCVVRWGGEEFLIVSRFSNRDDAALMAERIRKTIEQHDFTLPDGSILKKTCSIGFACFPFLHEHPMALTWEQVIDIADRALYAAKKSGRNRCVGIAENTTTNKDALYQHICSDLKTLIHSKELTVINAREDNLIWE